MHTFFWTVEFWSKFGNFQVRHICGQWYVVMKTLQKNNKLEPVIMLKKTNLTNRSYRIFARLILAVKYLCPRGSHYYINSWQFDTLSNSLNFEKKTQQQFWDMFMQSGFQSGPETAPLVANPTWASKIWPCVNAKSDRVLSIWHKVVW